MSKWKEKRLVKIKALMEELSVMNSGEKILFSHIKRKYSLSAEIKQILIDCKVIEETSKNRYNYIRTSSITDTIINKIDDKYITARREYSKAYEQKKEAKADESMPNKQLSILDEDVDEAIPKQERLPIYPSKAQKFGQIMGKFKQLENSVNTKDATLLHEIGLIHNKLKKINTILKENKKNNISLFWGLIKIKR